MRAPLAAATDDIFPSKSNRPKRSRAVAEDLFQLVHRVAKALDVLEVALELGLLLFEAVEPSLGEYARSRWILPSSAAWAMSRTRALTSV